MIRTYKGVSVGYEIVGRGPALVLLHGFLEDRSMFEPFLELWSKTYKVIAVDLLGHGETESKGYVHTMEDQADMVVDLLDQLKIKNAVFLGHSMGGYVALAVAEYYPERVKALIMQNSTAVADSEERKINRDRAIAAVKQDHRTFVYLSIANLFSEASRERCKEEIARLREKALQTPVQGIVAALEGMKIRKDREVIIHFAPFPIMYIAGKLDPVLPLTGIQEQLLGSSAELVVCEEGHMSHIEDPERYTAAVSRFLKLVKKLKS
ncbi:alpha/beta fold hydrolase [Flavobacterium aurantiibacter]|uniref:Alpha/beta hydrolase n=1 Tax=Flavobacterium aurantiibacter TaxID=2023067 RepID=A0A255ZR69_9FLAO|nr:alpha/beta fold hydrolase [Flavobacterium aurantiibacter]OYQ43899.1 alpha/beta hydrolase [Flavobacterium aurantiibacter]